MVFMVIILINKHHDIASVTARGTGFVDIFSENDYQIQ